MDFKESIREAVNRNNKEAGSNTPDYVLAEYLLGSLELFDKTIKQRDVHVADMQSNRIETLTRFVNEGGERERKLIEVIRDIIEMPTKSPGEQEIAWNNAVEILKTVQEDYNVPQYPDRYFRPEDYDPSQSQIPLGGCSAAFPDDDEANLSK